MSISSDKIRILTEEVIGEGNSKYMFGGNWKTVYDTISIGGGDLLTEEMVVTGLEECNFKDPNHVGLISLICPLFYTNIIDQGMIVVGVGKVFKILYKSLLYIWYGLYVCAVIEAISKREVSFVMLISAFCLISTSWSLMDWCRNYNEVELMYHTTKCTRKK